MTIAVDPSTPALASNFFFTATSAAFTPADNCVIVLGASSSTPNSSINLSVSNNGVALTWHQIIFINSVAGKKGAAGLWYATLPGAHGRTGITVSASIGGSGNGVVLKPLVLTGVDFTAVTDGTAQDGSGNLTSFSTTGITTTRAGSILVAVAEDSNGGSLGSSDLTDFVSGDTSGNGLNGIIGYKILGAAGSATGNISCGGSPAINWVVSAFKAALPTSPPPSGYRRRLSGLLVR